MDKIDKLFLKALKASLCNKKVNWDFEIGTEEWLRLFRQSEIHHVLPMIYDAVYDCPSARGMDPAFLKPFKKKTVQQVMVQTIKTSEFLQLYQFLRQGGIRPVMVKGIVCRELYPNPDYRVSGDEDMLILPDLFEQCHDRMLEYGMTVADPNVDIQGAYEVPYGKTGSPVYVELHKYLFSPDSGAFGGFNRFFETVHDQAVELEIQGVPVAAMDYTSHFFYLICHAFKHFLHSGFGLRQVCDIVLFANRYGSCIDWQEVLEKCRAVQAEKFTAALLKIGEKYLTFSPEKACFPDEWRQIQADETALLEDLLSSGIYGNSNMSRKHSSNITLSAVEADRKGKMKGKVKGKGSRHGNALLKTLFPPLKVMKAKYLYLRKYPFLLPAAWCSRILKYRREISRSTENNAADSIRIGNERIKLMEEYGIIEKQ